MLFCCICYCAVRWAWKHGYVKSSEFNPFKIGIKILFIVILQVYNNTIEATKYEKQQAQHTPLWAACAQCPVGAEVGAEFEGLGLI